MSAEWRQIAGFERYYVSDTGLVRGAKGGILVQVDGKSFYKIVGICNTNGRKTSYVHRLVCEAFHGPCPAGKQAAHLDGNRHNNAAINLAWVTPKENSLHRIQHGTAPRGEQVFLSRLTERQVEEIWLSPLSNGIVAKEYGVAKHTVWAIRNSLTWKHVTDSLPRRDNSARRKVLIPRPDEADRAILRGVTLREVGALFNVSETTAFRWKHEIQEMSK